MNGWNSLWFDNGVYYYSGEITKKSISNITRISGIIDMRSYTKGMIFGALITYGVCKLMDRNGSDKDKE